MGQLASWHRFLVLDALALRHATWELVPPLLMSEEVAKVFHGNFNSLAWLVPPPPIFKTTELDGMWERGRQASFGSRCNQCLG